MLITQSANKFLKRKRTINLDGNLIDLSSPIVAGIINMTPDSFYDGGVVKDKRDLLRRTDKMLNDGATIIDVGAVSTRPGARLVSTKIELDRLLPAVKLVRKKFPDAIISIDTFRSWVAVRVMEEIGAVIVNDISGGALDSKMFETIGRLQVPYILSHIPGSPLNMHENQEYNDIIHDISAYFSKKVRTLTKAGVTDVIIDPGFGFGKDVAQNYELLNRLDSFKVFQLPVMVGLSRKSMIWKVLDSSPKEALNGTSVLNSMALLAGADILRVHDVKEAIETIKLVQKLKITLE
ncbi:Dihydropteroate synthase [hydrothermal vent metagenome]|uniref:dihydropteroate synthase n=1 Tax=hydrothermal vent metagenome TaxID=652676 RepID=A0A3B0UKH2_9ZZZZ